MRPFLLALQFLTIVTLRSDLAARPGELARARLWFGLVGALLGLALALLGWLLARWLPPLPLAGALLFAWAALSRFLHLDGVADTADALVYPAERERALCIMKDTRIGAFGLCAVVLVLILKFACLAALIGTGTPWPWLVGVPALGRAAAAGLSALLPPARPAGLGAATGQTASLAPLFASGGVALLAAGLGAGRAGLAAGGAVALLTVVLGIWFRRRLGGVTGDTLGAAIELGEAAALLVLCACAAPA